MTHKIAICNSRKIVPMKHTSENKQLFVQENTRVFTSELFLYVDDAPKLICWERRFTDSLGLDSLLNVTNNFWCLTNFSHYCTLIIVDHVPNLFTLLTSMFIADMFEVFPVIKFYLEFTLNRGNTTSQVKPFHKEHTLSHWVAILISVGSWSGHQRQHIPPKILTSNSYVIVLIWKLFVVCRKTQYITVKLLHTFKSSNRLTAYLITPRYRILL
jgi:hypothetical protein